MKGEEKMERETTTVAHRTITEDKQNRAVSTTTQEVTRGLA